MIVTAGTQVLEFRTEIDAPIERVFAALTEGPELARWFCDYAESLPSPGGRMLMRWERAGSSLQSFEARWLVLNVPTSCAYEGGHSGYPDGYAGRIGFELARRGGETILFTRHRLPARPDYEPIADTYRAAWPRALDRLVQHLATATVVSPRTPARRLEE